MGQNNEHVRKAGVVSRFIPVESERTMEMVKGIYTLIH